MASHLTVTAKTATGTTATKAFNAQGSTEADNGVMGAFAAMLGGVQQVTDTKGTPVSKLEASLSKLANLVLGTDPDSKASKDAKDPDAIAAVIDATQPIQTPAEAKALLTDLVNGLATLKQALDTGETIDPELLGRINAALDGLAAQFNIDLSAHPSLEDLSALTAAIKPDQAEPIAQLTTALAPLVQTLLAGQAGPAPTAELSAAVKSVGEKLVSLLQSLNSGAVSADDMAALGLQDDTSFTADLKTALAKLLTPTPKVDVSTAAPVLADPALKLTEPTLTGKGDASAATSVQAPTETSDSGTKVTAVTDGSAGDSTDTAAQSSTDNKPASDKKPADDNALALTPAAAASEARTDAQANPASSPQVARADAVAPRVVQAGYQTSQQQLNLPQLAFELVRQVTDGNTRFQMRLDPPELGRIDVRLDIDKSGQVNARLVVDKSETLDLMQRDQRALERALQQAGLDSSKTNLEFSLKQNPFSGGQHQARDDQSQQFSLNGMGADDLEEAPPTINLYRASLTASGVNIIA